MKSIANALVKEDSSRVPMEVASIVGASSLGSTGLYSLRRKSGEILEGISGPQGLKVGDGCTLGFKDTGNSQRYSPFIMGKAKAGVVDNGTTQQSTAFQPRLRPH